MHMVYAAAHKTGQRLAIQPGAVDAIDFFISTGEAVSESYRKVPDEADVANMAAKCRNMGR